MVQQVSIDELRQLDPRLNNLTDDQLKEAILETPGFELKTSPITVTGDDSEISETDQVNISDRTWGEAFVDTGASLGQGIITAAEGFVGLADLVTPGDFFKNNIWKRMEAAGMGSPDDWKEWAQSLKSEEIQAIEEGLRAEGSYDTWEGIKEKISYIAENPQLSANIISEVLPSVYGGGIISKGTQKLFNSLPGWLTAGIGEGAISAGISKSEIDKIMEDEGKTITGEQEAYAALSGVLTGTIGLTGGILAKYLRLGNIDEVLVAEKNSGLSGNYIYQILGQAAVEGLEELPQSMQERVAYNVSIGRPPLEGIYDDGAYGAIAGALLGGPGGVKSAYQNNRADAITQKLEEEKDKKDKQRILDEKEQIKLDEENLPDFAKQLLMEEEVAELKEQGDLFEDIELPTLPEITQETTEETAQETTEEETDGQDTRQLNLFPDDDSTGRTSDEVSDRDDTGPTQGTLESDRTRVGDDKDDDGQPRRGDESQPTTLEGGVTFERFETVRPDGTIEVGYRRKETPQDTSQETTETPKEKILLRDQEEGGRDLTEQEESRLPNNLKLKKGQNPKKLSKEFRRARIKYIQEQDDAKNTLDRDNKPKRFNQSFKDKNGEDIKYLDTGSIFRNDSPINSGENEKKVRAAGVIDAAVDDVNDAIETLDTDNFDKQLAQIAKTKQEQALKDKKAFKEKLIKDGATKQEANKKTEDRFGSDSKIRNRFRPSNFTSFMTDREIIDLFNQNTGKKDVQHSPESNQLRVYRTKFKQDFSQDEAAIYSRTIGKVIPAYAKGVKLDEVFGTKTRGKGKQKVEDETPATEIDSMVDMVDEEIKRERNENKKRLEEDEKGPPKKELKTVVSVAKEKIAEIKKLIKTRAPITKILDTFSFKQNLTDPNIAYGPEYAFQISARVISEAISAFKGKVNIRFGATNNSKPAQFNPNKNEIVINADATKDFSLSKFRELIVHEASHYALDHLVDPENKSKLTKIQTAYVEEIDRVRQIYNNKFGKDINIKEFVAEVLSKPSMQTELQEISAEELFPSQKLSDRSPLERAKQAIMNLNIVSKFAGLLSYSTKTSSTRPITALPYVTSYIEAMLKTDYSVPSAQMRSTDISYFPEEENETKEKEVEDNNSMPISFSTTEPSKVVQVVKDAFKLFTFRPSQDTIDSIRTKFQNQRYVLKRLQDQFNLAEKLKFGEKDFNNFWDMFTISKGQALSISLEELKPYKQALTSTIKNLSKELGVSFDEAMNILGEYALTLHEPERRHMLFLLTAPINNTTKIKMGSVTATPADMRKIILDMVLSNEIQNMDPAQRKAFNKRLLKQLENLVAKYTDKLGYSPAGKTSIDELSSAYNVISGSTGAYTPEQIDKLTAKIEGLKNNAKVKDALDRAIAATKRLNQANNDVLKEAGHWSDKLDSLIEFYGFENHFPFKIDRTKSFKKDKDSIVPKTPASLFQYDGNAFGSTGRDFYGQMFAGVSSKDIEGVNPIEQTYKDSGSAASKYGLSGFLQAFRNAVRQGLLEGQAKIAKTYTFKELALGNVDEKLLKDPRSIFVNNSDGSMDIITIKNDKLLNAVRLKRKVIQNPVGRGLVETSRFFTTFLGQAYTRFSIKFAPYNYIRDVMTNAFKTAGELSLPAAAGMATMGVANLINGRVIGKGITFAKLWRRGDVGTIRELAKKDKFMKVMLEYAVDSGGSISVLQGVGADRAIQEFVQELKDSNNNLPKAKEVLTRGFDIYMQMFEFVSRAQSYAMLKPVFEKQIKKSNPNLSKEELDKAVSLRTASYVKQFTNFEEIGESGNTLGALFMFWNPSATGGAMAMDTIGPALRRWSDVEAGLPKSILDDPEALKKAKENYGKKKIRARLFMAVMMGAGYALGEMVSALFGADDDDEEDPDINLTDDPDRFTRNLRIPMGKDPNTKKEMVFNFPWGFGNGGLLAIGYQLYLLKKRDDMSFGDFMGNVGRIIIDSFFPIPISQAPLDLSSIKETSFWLLDSALPSAPRTMFEAVMGVDGFGSMLSTRYTGSFATRDNIPQMYQDFAQYISDETRGRFNPEPSQMYYIANTYFHAISQLYEIPGSAYELTQGTKYFELDRDIPFLKSFISTKANLEARDYYELRDKIENAKKIIDFQQQSNYDNYLAKINRNPGLEKSIEAFDEAYQQDILPLQQELNDINQDPIYTKKGRVDEQVIVKDKLRKEMKKIKKTVDEIIDEFGPAFDR